MTQPTFPGARETTAPGVESPSSPLAPAVDPTGDEPFLPSMDPSTFDGLFDTKTDPTAVRIPGQGPQAAGRASSIVDFAKSLLGTPYVWGGTSVRGVDCSGLIYLAYKHAGIDLPRVSFQQANSGQRVALSALQPGDLVAWDNSSRNNGADHIAVYAGNGEIIEAPRPGTNVRMRKLGQNEGAWGVRIGGPDAN